MLEAPSVLPPSQTLYHLCARTPAPQATRPRTRLSVNAPTARGRRTRAAARRSHAHLQVPSAAASASARRAGRAAASRTAGARSLSAGWGTCLHRTGTCGDRAREASAARPRGARAAGQRPRPRQSHAPGLSFPVEQLLGHRGALLCVLCDKAKVTQEVVVWEFLHFRFFD